MNYGLVGLYALFLIFVGYRGNSSALFANIGTDAKGFAPWVVAIVILAALDRSAALKPFVNPFIGLAILSFTLANYKAIAPQVNAIAGTKF